MKQPFEQLEEEYASYIGTRYGVSTNTGTSALHLALLSVGIGKGDEVIIPDFTMAACAFAVSYTGAKPVFVDCTDDLLIDPRKIEEKITKKTRAIMPVHIYGRVCPMSHIIELAQKYGLRIIEDCCEAQGATYIDSSFKGQLVGSMDIGVFSFYWNKIIPAEEGGMITTDDEDIVQNAKYYKNMCFGDRHDYIHHDIGYNYRMTNQQATFALSSLRMVNDIQAKRFRIQSWYDKYIKDEYKMPHRSVVWVYDIKHPRKDEIVKGLNDMGINARHGFKPMSMQPRYRRSYKHLNAYKLSKEVMYLPVTPFMTEEMVKEICQKLDSI